MDALTITPRSRFARIAAWCYAHKKRTVFAWFVALAVCVGFGMGVGSKEISSVRLPGTESQAAYDLLAKHFPAQNGDSDQVVFQARGGTSLRDPANRAAITAALAKVQAHHDVEAVAGPLSKGGQITPDGRIGVATITYDGSVDDVDPARLIAIEDAAFTARGATLGVEHGGMGAEIARYQRTQDPSSMIGIGAAAVVLLITFGSIVAAGIPLLTALLALGSTLGLIMLMSHLVDTPDFAMQVAELIGLGVGIDYALFVVTRYRAEVAAGRNRADAIVVAMDTAGRTVFFAACTVIIALLGLLTLGLSFMHGVAVGSALAVLMTMSAALTLLPALIGAVGGWIDRLALPLPHRRRRTARPEGAGWARWSRGVQRRPWIAAGAATAILVALTIPVLGMDLGSSDAGVDPKGTTTRNAYELIAKGFGPGINGSFLLATELRTRNDTAAAQRVAAAARGAQGIVSVSAPQLSPDGAVATIVAYPSTGPQDQATSDTLDRLRDDVLPPVERASGTTVHIGGLTASQEDFTATVASKLPLFVGMVVTLSALLLLAVFRSVLIPIKAAAMNLLSIGAALGVVTLVFQNGWLAGPLGIGTGPIESFLPVMLFAIVFGLSMDYEVFLVSRVHEEWEHGASPSDAVARGLATTGRVITAAASIMIVVFAAFALGDDRVIKLFGIGLSSAIFLDAVVIRCLLVPALMELMGARAWWMPERLGRFVPRLALEGSRPDPPRAPVPDAA